MADEGNIISNSPSMAPKAWPQRRRQFARHWPDLAVYQGLVGRESNAPESYQWTEAPEIHVDFNIAARALAPDVHESS
jgi:preprotein translocase subunit SecB